ncbi:MAG: SatD family protein [Candidatus Hodarchaeota archaeon]
MSPIYFIVTCDLIHSKKVLERSQVQRELRNAVNIMNGEYKQELVCPFITVWGDSFQGALKSLKGFYNLIETFEGLISVEFRCGIGVGEITTEISTTTLEMDGPAFHHSRAALEIAEKAQRRVWIQSGNNIFDGMVNSILALLYVLKSRWTPHQKEIIRLRRKGMTYAEIGEKKQISKQAVYKSLKTAKWEEAFLAIQTLNNLTDAYFEQLEDM